MSNLRRANATPLIAVMGLSLAAAGCKSAPASSSSNSPSTEAVEWVDFHTEVPLNPANFDGYVSAMFGKQAQAGQFMNKQAFGSGFYISSAADPANPAQVALTFQFDDGSPTLRTIAVTPASYETGNVFIQAAEAAMAKAQADLAQSPDNTEQFLIQYQVTSSQGGTLSFGLASDDGVFPSSNFSLVIDVTSPHTSLAVGHVNTPAANSAPFENVAGTVWFGMNKEDFDYFVGHAYGSEALGNQNFNNFELDPFDWLRLTVTPDIANKLVNVSFALATQSGELVQVAKAPASIYAGGAFQALVDQSITNMTNQEAAAPGSSTPYSIPFYYDEPAGGGVVQVIAQGYRGNTTVAYSIASPLNQLTDVSFVPFENVTVTPPSASSTETCEQLGYHQAEQGVFDMTFTASSVIKNNLAAGQQLIGDIDCSIFLASQVTVSGPIEGAVSVQDFTVPMANLLASTPPTFTSKTLQDANYQVLCAQITNGAPDGGSMYGDPVTLPIGGFSISCDVNPITVEFAITDPQQ